MRANCSYGGRETGGCHQLCGSCSGGGHGPEGRMGGSGRPGTTDRLRDPVDCCCSKGCMPAWTGPCTHSTLKEDGRADRAIASGCSRHNLSDV